MSRFLGDRSSTTEDSVNMQHCWWRQTSKKCATGSVDLVAIFDLLLSCHAKQCTHVGLLVFGTLYRYIIYYYSHIFDTGYETLEGLIYPMVLK